MAGGTGAVTADCGGAHLARSEHDSGAGTASSPWPLQTDLSLGALPTAPGCARGHVRIVAHEWGLQHLSDTAELVVSELVTNAIQASESLRIRADLAVVPVVRIWLTSDHQSMVIHVWDACPDMPVRRNASVDQDGGRGLMLVDALSKEWGACQKANGKVVWAMIASADP
jgi:anti-sigma regulatory factor (Ser/Thr protein kinase)